MSRKRARDPTPSDDGPSGSTSSHQGDISKLTEVMSELLKTTTSRRDGITVRGDVVPVFNPEDQEQDIESWCQKVEELRVVFDWSEEATIYFALSKLHGLAEVWYKGLSTLKLTWEEWKVKLKLAFPYKRDFDETLRAMLRRCKRPDETYTKYFYEKCALTNSCKIYGADAVSCIIGGIDDIVVKTGAKAGRHQTPESLHEFLNTVGNTHVPQITRKPVFNKFSKHQRLQSKSNSNQNRFDKAPTCFNCKKAGHVARVCPSRNENKAKPVRNCAYCRRDGHFESECFQKKRHQSKPIA